MKLMKKYLIALLIMQAINIILMLCFFVDQSDLSRMLDEVSNKNDSKITLIENKVEKVDSSVKRIFTELFVNPVDCTGDNVVFIFK